MSPSVNAWGGSRVGAGRPAAKPVVYGRKVCLYLDAELVELFAAKGVFKSRLVNQLLWRYARNCGWVV